jgi:hypothetical protein
MGPASTTTFHYILGLISRPQQQLFITFFLPAFIQVASQLYSMDSASTATFHYIFLSSFYPSSISALWVLPQQQLFITSFPPALIQVASQLNGSASTATFHYIFPSSSYPSSISAQWVKHWLKSRVRERAVSQSSKRNQNPSRYYYNSITNLKFFL